MKVNDMKEKLKKHELGERKKEFPDMQIKKVSYIKPWSDEMKEVMVYLGGLNDSDGDSDYNSDCSE